MEQSFELSCEVSSVFPALNPTSHFLPRKTIFSMVICNFKSQLKLLAQIGSLIKFRLEQYYRWRIGKIITLSQEKSCSKSGDLKDPTIMKPQNVNNKTTLSCLLLISEDIRLDIWLKDPWLWFFEEDQHHKPHRNSLIYQVVQLEYHQACKMFQQFYQLIVKMSAIEWENLKLYWKSEKRPNF